MGALGGEGGQAQGGRTGWRLLTLEEAAFGREGVDAAVVFASRQKHGGGTSELALAWRRFGDRRLRIGNQREVTEVVEIDRSSVTERLSGEDDRWSSFGLEGEQGPTRVRTETIALFSNKITF